MKPIVLLIIILLNSVFEMPLLAQDQKLFDEMLKYFNQNSNDSIKKELKILKEASIYLESADYRAAIKAVEDLIPFDKESIIGLLFTAAMYENLHNDYMAGLLYEKALKILGNRALEYPLNIYLIYGDLLNRMGQFEKAIDILKIASNHSTYEHNDPTVYEAIALANKYSGNISSAIITYFIASTIDSSKTYYSVAIESLTKQKEFTDSLSSLSKPTCGVTLLELKDSLRSLFNKEVSQLLSAIDNQSFTLNKLNCLGYKWEAEKLSIVLIDRIISDIYTNLKEKKYIKAIENIESLLGLRSLEEMDHYHQKNILYTLILSQQGMGQYTNAASILAELHTKLTNWRDPDTSNINRLILDLADKTFKTVSFDPSTGHLRTKDYNDFVKAPYEPEGRPHGSTSPDEDAANMATVAATIWQPKFNKIITERIEEKNFELPIKALLHSIYNDLMFSNTIRVDKNGDYLYYNNSFKVLEGAIKSNYDSIPSPTLEAFDVADKLIALMKLTCQQDTTIVKEIDFRDLAFLDRIQQQESKLSKSQQKSNRSKPNRKLGHSSKNGNSQKEKRSFSSSLVKMLRISGIDTLTKKFRDIGLDVIVINDNEGSVKNQDTIQYNVTWIGNAVEPSTVRKVIQLVRDNMPWLRYIFIQYEDVAFENQIYLGAHNTWIEHLGLKKLEKKDFNLLANPKLSKDKMRALINTYKQ
jgi:tetratricopeptide (TPR) repeat protein